MLVSDIILNPVQDANQNFIPFDGLVLALVLGHLYFIKDSLLKSFHVKVTYLLSSVTLNYNHLEYSVSLDSIFH